MTEKQRKREARNNKIADMYQAGMSMQQIGDEYDLTRAAIQLILIDRGIPRRPTGRQAPVIAFPQEPAK